MASKHLKKVDTAAKGSREGASKGSHEAAQKADAPKEKKPKKRRDKNTAPEADPVLVAEVAAALENAPKKGPRLVKEKPVREMTEAEKKADQESAPAQPVATFY